MSLHLRIDRLVLEGTALTQRDGARLQAALGAELAILLKDSGLQPELAKGIALPSLPLTTLAQPAAAEPSALGRQLARHLAAALTTQARP